MLKMPVTGYDVWSTFIISVNELPGSGSKGLLWYAGISMLSIEDEAIILDLILRPPPPINDSGSELFL